MSRVIPTGVPALDEALGVGGWPRGVVSEIFGDERSPRLELALRAVASVQAAGLVVALVDGSRRISAAAAEAGIILGSRLLLHQPSTAEMAHEVVESLARSGKVDLIVAHDLASLPSYASAPPPHGYGLAGGDDEGRRARLMSHALRKLLPIAHHTGVALLYTSEMRRRTGVSFGMPEASPGGQALKFYASVRVHLCSRVLANSAEDDEPVLVAKVVKNKLAAPFREACWPLRAVMPSTLSDDAEPCSVKENRDVARTS